MQGTARAGDGIAAAVCRASPSLSASSTAFVISSTNNGIPSVRSTISAVTSAGRSLFPTMRAMMAAASRSPSRLSAKLVTCDRPAQGALNSGRKVTMSSTGRVLIWSTVRPNTSRLVGSTQCASSTIISAGRCLVSPASCAVKASCVLCLRSSGAKSSAGYRPSFGSESISAKSAASWHRSRSLREHGIELVELRLRGVVVRQSSGTFHLADDRIERAVGVLRGAEIAQARVRLSSKTFQQRRRQSRLADACLAGKEHYLAFAGLRLRPAP